MTAASPDEGAVAQLGALGTPPEPAEEAEEATSDAPQDGAPGSEVDAGDGEAEPADGSTPPPTRLRLRCVGIPPSARQRLESIGTQIEDDPTAPVDGWLVSTRLGPDDLATFEREREERGVRTIVLAHTGAERVAVQLVSAGAEAVVGEGNEEALLGLVEDDRTPHALLTSFERRFGADNGTSSRGVDPATGLADGRGFERRISTLGEADEVPRVLFCKVLSDRWSTPTPDPVVAVQRRRLATMLAHASGAADQEIYATGHGEFGLLGAPLSPHDADRLGGRLVALTATFRDRGVPLRLVVGHAGPEVASNREELIELARRALEVAAVDGVRTVLGAEDLAHGVSVTTELEAIVRLLDRIEPALPEGRGHGERVGRMAAQLARRRGWSSGAVSRAQLAGHLHDVGRAGLPSEAVDGPDGLEGELLAAWQTFPERSADLLRLTAGGAVADAVHGQRERWDGTGFPQGHAGADIPEQSRLLAVVHAVDELVGAQMVGPALLARRLRERAGESLDPELVDLAVEHLNVLLSARG